MVYNNLNVKNYEIDGRQKNVPSVFPFYSKSEIDVIFALKQEERAKKLAKDLKIDLDDGESLTVCLEDNLFVTDFTCGGETDVRFSYGVSPFVMSAILDAICQMELDGEEVVLGVPSDSGVLLSACLLKQMGFPIQKIVVLGDCDFTSENVCIVEEDIKTALEYIADFYDDFDFLLGVEEAKASLALDIYTNGFSQKALLVNAFGYNQSVMDCCFALSGKKKSEKDSARWIEENCALPCELDKNERKFTQIAKNLMKELCNLL